MFIMSCEFLSIVNLFTAKVPSKSTKVTASPTNGLAGNCIVATAAAVLTKNLWLLSETVIVEPSPTTVTYGVPPPKPVQLDPL